MNPLPTTTITAACTRPHRYTIHQLTDTALYDGPSAADAITALADVDLDSDTEAYAVAEHTDGDDLYCARESQRIETAALAVALLIPTA